MPAELSFILFWVERAVNTNTYCMAAFLNCIVAPWRLGLAFHGICSTFITKCDTESSTDCSITGSLWAESRLRCPAITSDMLTIWRPIRRVQNNSQMHFNCYISEDITKVFSKSRHSKWKCLLQCSNMVLIFHFPFLPRLHMWNVSNLLFE